jgi:tetratricopeptide (TPR) repeat protein
MQAKKSISSAALLRRFAFTLPLAMAAAAPTLGHAQSAASAPSEDAQEVQRLIKEGKFPLALKSSEDSLAKNPNDPQMRFRRGVILSMLDRKAEALAVFQKLVEDHPEMPAPYNNMAVIYGSQGDYEKARAALDKAIRTNPAYSTAYQNLGDVYAQLASQAYSKALQLDKTDGSVQPKLALLRELTSGPNTAPTSVAVAKADLAIPPKEAAKPAPTVKPPVEAPAPVKAVVASAPPPKSVPPATKPEATPALAAVAEVESAVRAWASAWSNRDFAAYVNAYTGDFAGQSKSHRDWEAERRSRIVPRKSIKVEVSDLRVNVNGDHAQARFRQSYESGALNINSRKTLELVKANSGKWQIKEESAGG